MGFLRKMFTSVRHEPDTPKPAGERNFQLQEVGFHGDRYLLAVADALLERSDWFIETGTNVASTLRHVARRHPRVLCLSCEPDPEAFAHALSNTEGLPNVGTRNETSQEFLAHLAAEHADLATSQCTLWLDAHGYGFAWPLREEVAYFTTHLASGRRLIDDFLVPGHKEFGTTTTRTRSVRSTTSAARSARASSTTSTSPPIASARRSTTCCAAGGSSRGGRAGKSNGATN